MFFFSLEHLSFGELVCGSGKETQLRDESHDTHLAEAKINVNSGESAGGCGRIAGTR